MTRTMVRRIAHCTRGRRDYLIVAVAAAVLLVPAGAASGGGGNPNSPDNGNAPANGNASPGHQPPTNTSPPTISGSAVIGQTLSGNAGSWSGGHGMSYSYQWLRCDTSGSACTATGATGTSYSLTTPDAGTTLRLAVTATNSYGSASATSAQTAVVTQPSGGSPVSPSVTTPPSISGSAQAGQTLSATAGVWTGTAPITYAYQWRDCDSSGANCAAISSANGTTYVLTSNDVNHTITVAVTASNTAGQATSVSAATGVVQAAPGGTPQPSFPIYATWYYPWFPETWTVNGAHVFYHPTLGYYSTTDVPTEQAQIRAMQYAGLKAAISSWWGAGHYTDTRLKELMQTTVAMGSPLKWTIYYEAEGTGDPTVSQIASDLAYIRDNLATSSAYLKINGKFVVFVYNANDNTCNVADRWAQANAQIGGAAYIDLKVFLGYRNCASQPASWHQYSPNVPTDDQPGYGFSISPGWWRADQTSPVLARDPSRWLSNVASMVASGEPWRLVTTFNEWTEGTAVESAQEWASPSGYGTYLDALHSAINPP